MSEPTYDATETERRVIRCNRKFVDVDVETETSPGEVKVTTLRIMELKGPDRSEFQSKQASRAVLNTKGKNVEMKPWKEADEFLLSRCVYTTKDNGKGGLMAGPLVDYSVIRTWGSSAFGELLTIINELSGLAPVEEDDNGKKTDPNKEQAKNDSKESTDDGSTSQSP